MTTNRTTRRRFAKGIGSAALLGAVGTASAQSQASMNLSLLNTELQAGGTTTGSLSLAPVPADGVYQIGFTIETGSEDVQITNASFANDFSNTNSIEASPGSSLDVTIINEGAIEAGSSGIRLVDFAVEGVAPGEYPLTVTDVTIYPDTENAGEDSFTPSVQSETLSVVPGPTPTISTTVEEPVYVNQQTTARILMDRVPADLNQGKFEVVVNPSVLEIVDASYSQDFARTDTIEIDDDGGRASLGVFNDDGALEVGQTNVEIATLTLEANSVGESVVDPNNNSWVVGGESTQLEYDNGVGTVASPAPVYEGNAPTDPDGDGLYEDVNGNGNMDLGDSVTLFQNRESAPVQNHVPAYDFNGNDDIDLGDVVTLFQESSN